MILEHFKLGPEILEEIVKATQSDKAALLLLNENPTIDQLDTILSHSNLREEAAIQLLKKELSIENLHKIIKYSSFKTEAWEKFITLSPTVEEIIKIIQETDFDDQAWAYLIEQQPSNDKLDDLISDYWKTGKKRKEAADYILNNSPNVSDLIDLIWEEIRLNEAWVLMRQMIPEEHELSSVVWRLVRLESSMKNEVANWCLNFKPNVKELWYILEYSNQKDEAALQLINSPLELHELADILVNSTSEPILKYVCERLQIDINVINESELIREIAPKILNDPNLLDVNHWHNGENHCLGGWAITINKDGQEIERQYGSEIAACLLLPNYKHLFFTDKETVIKELKEIMLMP